MRGFLAAQSAALLCCIAAIFSASPVPVTADVGKGTEKAQADLDARIAALIEQLGSPQYHSREKAQEDLKRLGAAAIDALLAAQEHYDTEVAMRARFLVRSVPIQWSKEEDAAQVRQLFQGYSDADMGQRQLRARHLSTLENQSGIGPLCRIMRFDPNPIVSKEAAVLVLRCEWPASDDRRREIAKRIRDEVAACRRPGAKWLLAYSKSLEAQAATADEWEELTRAEANTFATNPQHSSREIVRDLLHWQAELLLRLERIDDAVSVLRRTFDLLELLDKDRMPAEVYALLEWSIEHDLHRVADELSQHFAAQFKESPRLQYGLAESQLKRGQREIAEATADQARKIAPEDIRQHWLVGWALLNRILTDWAEQEFRYVISRTKAEDQEGASFRWMFANRLFDWGKEGEAADLVKAVVEAANANPQLYEVLDPYEPPDSTEVQGYMNYFYGMHHARLGDRDKQMEYFSKAIELVPTNSDFLIGMFRVADADEKWKQDVKQRIDARGGELRTEMREIEDKLQRPMDDDQRNTNRMNLARDCNEFAWLISNTDGDRREAVRASLRSLEMIPDNPAYLDTLGRCYYAAGDFELAVKYQTQAVKKMPTMLVMRRQLAMFQKALEESPAKPK